MGSSSDFISYNAVRPEVHYLDFQGVVSRVDSIANVDCKRMTPCYAN